MIQLPDNKTSTICKLIYKLSKQNRVGLKKFQQLAGKLQHTSIGIPGGKSPFTPFDMAMAGDPEMVVLTPTVRQALGDWCHLIEVMNKHPTSVF